MYSEIYKAWKSEKSSAEAQSLPNDFYQKAETYLHTLDEEKQPLDEHSAKGSLTVREAEVVSRLLRELKEVRLRKLLALTQSGATVSEANLTEEEAKLIKDLEKSFLTFSQHNVEPNSGRSGGEEAVELSVVRFLQDIPEIVGTDLKIYGPYKKEDVGSLPLQNVRALVRQGAVKEIQVRPCPTVQGSSLNPAHQQ